MNTLVSASQIKSWRDCKRRWALRSIAKLPQPTSPSQALGIEIDDGQLQPYLRDGRPFDFTKESGYIAASALPYLPEGGGKEVQKHFILPSPSKQFGYQGYLDLWLPTGGLPVHEGMPDDDSPVVVDFKSTKDFKWALTPEELKTDVQAQLYATWAMFSTGKRKVHLAWIYLLTRGAKKSMRRFVTVDAAHVFEQFKAIDKDACEMFAVREGCPDVSVESAQDRLIDYALELPPTPSACGDYGGCPYQHVCNLSPSQFVDSIESDLAHRVAPQGDELVHTSKRSLPVMNTLDLFANLAKKKEASGEPASVMGVSDRDVPAPPEDQVPAAFATPPTRGINPPEQHLPPPPAPVVATPTEPESKKTKRGRPKAEAAPAPSPVETSSPAPTQVEASDRKIGTLYVDCHPLGGGASHAEDLFAHVHAAIKKQFNVADYRLIDFKGAGVFAATLGEYIDAGPGRGDVVLDSHTPEGTIAKSVLFSRAARVVQGVR